jgi:hypothetical protein
MQCSSVVPNSVPMATGPVSNAPCLLLLWCSHQYWL